MKIKLVNNSLVTVGGKLPNAVFIVDALDEKTPSDPFWRNRLKDDDGIALYSEPKTTPQKTEPKTADDAKPAAKSGSKSEVTDNE